MNRDLDCPDRPEQEPARTAVEASPGQQELASPLSRERESLDLRGYRYQVSPSDLATLREIGRFRTIAIDDLAKYQYGGQTDQMREDLGTLRAQGLIRQRAVWTGARSGKLNLVVLTRVGRELLERNGPAHDRQALYSGFVKPAEVAHDAAIYRMYQVEAARILREGGRPRRIVLDYELKQKVYRPLAKIRPQVTPAEYAKRQAEVAAENRLKVVHGKILLPDLRIEYETAAGVGASIDLELATHHYRVAAMRGKAAAGFKLYAPGDSAGRLAAAFDPELVAQIFSF